MEKSPARKGEKLARTRRISHCLVHGQAYDSTQAFRAFSPCLFLAHENSTRGDGHWCQRKDKRPVLRSISLVGSVILAASFLRPSMRSSINLAASLPMSRAGMCTVVRAGVM